MYNSISKEELYAEVLRIYEEIGEINTKIFKINSNLNISVNYQFHKYGGLQNICKELEIPFTYGIRHTKKDFIDDIMRVYEEQGAMSSDIYSKYGKWSITGLKRHFGTFNNMLEELGFTINMYKNVTKEDIKKDVAEFYAKYNTTSSTRYRKLGKYSQCTIDRLFGSWKNLMEELGFDYIGETYGIDEILRQVRSVYDKYGVLSKSLIDDECDFSYQALAYYFKNKDEISEAIGVKNAFNNSLSVKADLIHKILKILFGEDLVIKEKTWNWLINSKTGKHLYVDFYLTEFNIAIEFDGQQHETFVEQFHKNNNGFEDYKYRDKVKSNLLKNNNVKLIRIPYNAKITTKYINSLVINCLLSV